MNITRACVERPVLAWMIMLATMLFGGIAGSRIGISQFPDVDLPTISVQVAWEGANPEVMEQDIVDILEEALVQVEGVRTIGSSSRQGSAQITVELDLSRNVDLALQDVQSKVAQAQRRLPRDMEPPTVSKSNPEDQPIMWIAVTGPFSRQFLADVTRYRIKERLQGITGVGEVTLGGSVERNVRIWIDASKLDERSISVDEVITALSRQHVEMPAGILETQGRQITLRVMGEALDLGAVRKLVVGRAGSSPVYLEDVALIEDGFEDTARISRANGESAQTLGVRKQRGSNAVGVAAAIEATLDDIRKTLPRGMSVIIANNSTRFIAESVHEIEFELCLSIFLTGLVCWLFLGSLSSTLNVLLAIPMSLLGTVAVIYFLGYTLNTFTLLGLALAVGIVVDDAIMVLENIARHGEMGKSPVQAALDGTAEISFSALAATIAVVAIFTPTIFMSGVVGKYFQQFGVTLSIAVLLSYVEAITLAPARCAQMLKISHGGEGFIGRMVNSAFTGLERTYAWSLAKSLRRPVLVLCVTTVFCIGSFSTLTGLPREFVPSHDVSRVVVRMQSLVGTDIWETDRLIKRAEVVVGKHPEVISYLAMVGGGGGGSATAANTANMMLNLAPPEKRRMTQAEISQVLRKELGSIPGLKATVQDQSQQGFTAQRGYPLEFSLRGPDWDELARLSDVVIDDLRESGAVVDLDSDYRVGMPEIRIVPDPARAADLGISMQQIGTTVNALVGGLRVGRFTTGGRRVDIRLRLLAGQRTRPEDLSRLKMRTRNGQMVPLSSLIRFEELPKLQAITRRDRERAISMFANIAAGHSQEEGIRIVEALSRKLPTGYSLVLGGASVTFRESTGMLIFALIVGIIVAYMVLACQFNSYIHPVTVLTILPLSVSGAAWALYWGGMTLNMFSMIGLLLLMGISKKNSIILVDFANQMRASGLGPVEAMQAAGPARLRPILMTSAATMMAAIPPALGLGPGAETRAPMAIGIIGGLVVSTTLSLLVVPAFYLLADRVTFRTQTEAKTDVPGP